jgi:hypothetical protein
VRVRLRLVDEVMDLEPPLGAQPCARPSRNGIRPDDRPFPIPRPLARLKVGRPNLANMGRSRGSSWRQQRRDVDIAVNVEGQPSSGNTADRSAERSSAYPTLSTPASTCFKEGNERRPLLWGNATLAVVIYCPFSEMDSGCSHAAKCVPLGTSY